MPAPDRRQPRTDARPQKRFFAQLRELRAQLQAMQLPIFDRYELSMGMSDDFESAIAEGSNWIRVGRALFGSR